MLYFSELKDQDFFKLITPHVNVIGSFEKTPWDTINKKNLDIMTSISKAFNTNYIPSKLVSSVQNGYLKASGYLKSTKDTVTNAKGTRMLFGAQDETKNSVVWFNDQPYIQIAVCYADDVNSEDHHDYRHNYLVFMSALPETDRIPSVIVYWAGEILEDAIPDLACLGGKMFRSPCMKRDFIKWRLVLDASKVDHVYKHLSDFIRDIVRN